MAEKTATFKSIIVVDYDDKEDTPRSALEEYSVMHDILNSFDLEEEESVITNRRFVTTAHDNGIYEVESGGISGVGKTASQAYINWCLWEAADWAMPTDEDNEDKSARRRDDFANALIAIVNIATDKEY